MGATVEDFIDRLERFLTGCVPDLKLERHVVNADKQRTELDPYGDFVILLELVVAHAVHQARFSDTTISYHD